MRWIIGNLAHPPVSGGEGGGAGLRVPRDLAGLGGAADGDGVDGGGVAVAVAVVLYLYWMGESGFESDLNHFFMRDTKKIRNMLETIVQ